MAKADPPATAETLTALRCVEARVTASDHLLDALICALLGQASVLGRVEPIPLELRELARAEGWIHLPQRQPLVEFEPLVAVD
jgi:hypothetical protein